MKQTIDFNQFNQSFIDYGRTNNFCYAGRKALFEYLEEYEDDTGEEIELDVIALCCDFCESDYEDVANDYMLEIDPDLDSEERRDFIQEYLNDNTMVIYVDDNTVIYQGF